MKGNRIARCAMFAAGVFFSVAAHAALTVTPITWNIVGLDSNSPATGPYRFPVGARICSDAGAATATVNFIWDDGQGVFVGDVNASAYVNLRAGSSSSIVNLSVPAASCADAYFEAEVTKNAASFDRTRRYHITA